MELAVICSTHRNSYVANTAIYLFIYLFIIVLQYIKKNALKANGKFCQWLNYNYIKH